MHRNIITILKNLTTKFDLNKLDNLIKTNKHLVKESYSLNYEYLTKNDLMRAFIFLVGFRFKDDPVLATTILLNCLEDCDSKNMNIIFKFKLVLDENTIKMIKNYIKIHGCRRYVRKFLIRKKIFYEDAFVYNIEELNKVLQDKNVNNKYTKETIFKICATINTPKFKHTKSLLKTLSIDKLIPYFPKLNKRGIRNIQILNSQGNFKTSIMPITGKGEIEDFKMNNTFNDILKYFLKDISIKSFYDADIIINYFNQKMKNIKKKEIKDKDNEFYNSDDSNSLIITNRIDETLHITEYSTFKNEFINKVIIPKIKSHNFYNRYIGINFFLTIAENNDIEYYKDCILDLVFDKCHEIRDSVKGFIPRIITNYFSYITYLKSDDVAIIDGTINILEYESPDKIFAYFNENILKIIINENYENINCSDKDFFLNLNDQDKIKKIIKTPIYGFIKYFATFKYKNKTLKKLISYIHKYTIKRTKKIYWKTCKECCHYFYKIGKYDKIMKTLLKTDHFGIISNIKSFLKFKNFKNKKWLEKGINKLRNRKKIVRRGGGLGVYFLILIRNGENYKSIKTELIKVLSNDGENFDTFVFNSSDRNEIIIINCLNIFYGIMEYSILKDIFFYFDLSLKALLSNSFGIKNCGCGIFCMLMKKINNKYDTLERFFKIYLEYKDLFKLYFDEGIKSKNKEIIYFILYIYDKKCLLDEKEIELVKKSKLYGEFIYLKATNILTKYINA